MNKLKLLFAVSRPLSWVNTAFPFVAGYLVLGGNIDPILLVGGLFFLIPYNVLMYGVNDVYDYESDMKNPRKGGVEGAVTPRKYHQFILASSCLLGLPFIVVLGIVGTVMSNLVLAVLLFAVVAYSVKGLRFKEKPFLDSITSSLHFVGPLVYAFSLLGATTEGWVIAAAFFLWGAASHAFGAVQDIIPDREGELHSIATYLGASRTVQFSLTLYVLAAILLLATGEWPLMVAGVLSGLYGLNVWEFTPLSDAKSPHANKGWKRFLVLNYVCGAVVTMLCIFAVTSLR